MADKTSKQDVTKNVDNKVTIQSDTDFIDLNDAQFLSDPQIEASQVNKPIKTQMEPRHTLEQQSANSLLDNIESGIRTPQQSIVARVTKICGSPTIEGADGSITLLEVGDVVHADDKIHNPDDSVTQIELVDGELVLLSEDSSFNGSDFDNTETSGMYNSLMSSGPWSAYPQDSSYNLNGSGLSTDELIENKVSSSDTTHDNTSNPYVGFAHPHLPDAGTLSPGIVASTLFKTEVIGLGNGSVHSIQLRNTATTPAISNDLLIELDGANITDFTFDPGATPVAVPVGGALLMMGNGDWVVYDAGGTVVANGNQAALNWAFADSNGDARVDTRDEVGVNIKHNTATVIDTFQANGASFSDSLWSAGPIVPASALAVLGTFLSHESFSGQIGDQLAVLNELGIARPNTDGIVEPTANNDNIFFARSLVGDSDSSADWTTTNQVTQGLAPNVSSPNPQDMVNDDFNPQAPNSNLDAGQTVAVGTVGNDLLVGAEGSDFMYGGAGDDDLQGGANNDFLFGDSGHDTLDGSTGADLLVDGDGRDLLVGGEGNDILIGSYIPFGQATPLSDEADVLVGDVVHTGENLLTFNIVMVIDASQSMGAVAHDVTANVNANVALAAHSEFQVRGLPAGTILESTGGYTHIIGAGGWSSSMTKTQLDNLSIQLPGAEFTGGATPPNFSLDVRGRSAPGAFDEFLSLATADGSSAPIVSMRAAVASLNQNLVDQGYDANTQIRIISFDSSATVESFALQTDFNPSDANLQTVIDSITPYGQASMGVGVQAAVNHLLTQDGNDIIYLFSDGNDFNGFAPSSTLVNQIASENIDLYTYGVAIDGANSNLNVVDLQAAAQLGTFSSSDTPIIINPSNAAEVLDNPIDSVVEVQRLGSDVIIGGEHDDVIFGDAMLIDFSQISVNSVIPVATLMTDFNDDPVNFVKTHLVNSTFDYPLSSLGAEDFIDAGAGNDIVWGGGGDDEIIGGAGNDILIAGYGDDYINVGNQNDGEEDLILLLRDADGNDVIDGFDNQGATHDVVSLDALFDALGIASGAARVADVNLTQVASDVVLTINGVPDFSLRFENSSGNTVGDFSVGTAASDDIFVG